MVRRGKIIIGGLEAECGDFNEYPDQIKTISYEPNKDCYVILFRNGRIKYVGLK